MGRQSILNLNSSLYKYLYDNLGVNPNNVKIFESIINEDFSNFTKWVTIDQLTNNLGAAPIQLYFLHCAVQKANLNAVDELDKLLDLAIPLFEEGQPIEIFSRTTNLSVGAAYVTNPSLGPILEHGNGGIKRTITIGLTYEGN